MYVCAPNNNVAVRTRRVCDPSHFCSDSVAPYDSAEDYEDVEAGVHLFTDDEEEVRVQNNFTGHG